MLVWFFVQLQKCTAHDVRAGFTPIQCGLSQSIIAENSKNYSKLLLVGGTDVLPVKQFPSDNQVNNRL